MHCKIGAYSGAIFRVHKTREHIYTGYVENEQENGKISRFTFEERRRLQGFFSLLLKIDKRLHPEYYQPNQNKNDESNNTGESVAQEAGFQ